MADLNSNPITRRVISSSGSSKFLAQISDFANKTLTILQGGSAAAIEEFATRLIARSPVGPEESGHSGRFKGNWLLSEDVIDESYDPENLDPEGNATLSTMLEVLATIDFSGDFSVWISNHAPYAVKLEFGSSTQAPSGMVRITALEWSDILQQTFVQGGGGSKSSNDF